MDNIIEVKDVKKVFGSEKTVSTKVLDGVNMNVKEGEFVQFEPTIEEENTQDINKN